MKIEGKTVRVAVIGAGKTGRGFLGRLLCEGQEPFLLIDRDRELIGALREQASFPVSFFGQCREEMQVSGFGAYTWDTLPEDALDDVELFLTAVGGRNLPQLGCELARRLHGGKTRCLITCENASHPAKTLLGALLSAAPGLPVRAAEATVFCTTIEDRESASPLAISSEEYPCLQYDADALPGFAPPVPGIRPISQFGNFLTRKLYTYNAASCLIAYLGWLRGYVSYGDAANDPEITALLDFNYEQTNAALCREFGYAPEEQREFAALSRRKFRDRTIADTVERNAREPQRKLAAGERVIGPMRLIAKAGGDPSALIQTAAAALLYDNDGQFSGEDDWHALLLEKGPEGVLREICGLTPGEEFRLYERIWEQYQIFSRQKQSAAR